MRFWAVLLATLAQSIAAGGEKPRVSFELIARPGTGATVQQQWYQALSGLGLTGLRIRSGGSGDEMDIVEQGTAAAPQYKVVGILAADNMLYLPGGKFSLKDTARLRTWLDNLAD